MLVYRQTFDASQSPLYLADCNPYLSLFLKEQIENNLVHNPCNSLTFRESHFIKLFSVLFVDWIFISYNIFFFFANQGEKDLTPGAGCSKQSSLRGQLVKSITTSLLNTLIFFVEKMREAFAMQKLLTFLQKKYWHILDINV